MAEREPKIGEAVVLKASSYVPMTISSVKRCPRSDGSVVYEVGCLWFDVNSHVQERTFNMAVLQIIE